MKRNKIYLIASLLLVCSNCWADKFDFSANASTGQTLYFDITSDSTVSLVAPNDLYTSNSNWAGYETPKDSLSIPQKVTFNGTTYAVKKIGYGALGGCKEMTSVKIPNSIEEIGDWAFTGSGLNVIDFPSTPVMLGVWVFESTPWMDRQPAGIVYLNNVLLYYKGVIPDNLELDIPQNINSIAGRAFNYGYEAGQEKLISVHIPGSVKYIGEYAFYKCHLNTVYIEEGVESIGRSAFSYNYFSEVTIPHSVKYIGSSAFSNCGSLTTVNYNAIGSLDNISGSFFPIFRNSSNLESFNWGSDVQYIPPTLLSGCTKITGELSIPSSVKYIGYEAFNGCSGFTGSLKIDNRISEIGEKAFMDCNGINNVNVDAYIIGKYAFYNCSGVTELTIGENIDSIGSGAFEKLNNLKTLYYNAKDIRCEKYGFGFDSNSSITSIIFGNKVKRIPDYFMQQAPNLTSVIFPSSLLSIGEWSFYNCGILGELVIPENVQKIGAYSFYYCTKVSSVKSLNTAPPDISGSYILYSCYDKPLYVPNGSLESYKNAEGWKSFQTIIATGIDNVNINSIAVYTQNNQIHIEGAFGRNISVYHIDGSEIASLKGPTNHEIITVPSTGIYCVKVDKSLVRKVFVSYLFP